MGERAQAEVAGRVGHTPGPWRPFARNGFVAVMQGKRSEREVIHWAGFDGSDFPRHAIANAWLIAAAPELLAALKAMHDHAVEYARINNLFNSDGSPATFHELLQARAAIAKAEGR